MAVMFGRRAFETDGSLLVFSNWMALGIAAISIIALGFTMNFFRSTHPAMADNRPPTRPSSASA